MTTFTKHTATSAPADSQETLAKIEDRYDFIPNLAAYIAESPIALAGVLGLNTEFDKASFTAQEQQVVLLTVSSENQCPYCQTAHHALGLQSGLDNDIIESIKTKQPLKDERLNVLTNFTRMMNEQKGHVSEADIDAFLTAGFTKAQVFEVIVAIALKTLTNYSNHVANAEPNEEFIGMIQQLRSAAA